jgi:hypothetical protein
MKAMKIKKTIFIIDYFKFIFEHFYIIVFTFVHTLSMFSKFSLMSIVYDSHPPPISPAQHPQIDQALPKPDLIVSTPHSPLS